MKAISKQYFQKDQKVKKIIKIQLKRPVYAGVNLISNIFCEMLIGKILKKNLKISKKIIKILL